LNSQRTSLDWNNNKNNSTLINFNESDYVNYLTKTEFQKKLVNENSIIKYKSTCIIMLKEDQELKKLCDILNITSFEKFVENLFNDKIYLYKLENMLINESSKIKKEKFFKDEIKQILDTKLLEKEYSNKINKLNIALEDHIKFINQFEFYK
jgi:hypothetical protein